MKRSPTIDGVVKKNRSQPLINKQCLPACSEIVRSLTFKNLTKEGITMEEFEVNESNIYYLKESPIRKAIAHLSIPMMVGISATTIYNLINAYFIGLIHDTNMMSAITLAMPITIILMAVGNMFGVGGGSFITRLLGNGDTQKGKKVAGYSFYASIILGIIIGIVAIIFMNPLFMY